MKYRKIILLGMMGAGKSAVSKELAKKTGLKNFELDELFENKFGSISSYFKNFGEDEFRKKETEILKQILKNDSYIISTGGGIILKKENRDLIFNNEICSIYLNASYDTIYNRIKDDTKRPLLKVDNPYEEIKNILLKRQKYYKMASMEVITDNKTIDEVVLDIWKKLQ